MSRKNRYKFRNREANHTAMGTSSGSVVQPNAGSMAARSQGAGNSGAFAQHAAEYKIISRDLIRLVILNAVMLVALFALYYANRSSGVVEKLFNQIF